MLFITNKIEIINHCNMFNTKYIAKMISNDIDNANGAYYIYRLDARITYVDQSMLERPEYSKLKVLICPNNSDIYNLNHLVDLEELNCSGIKSEIGYLSIHKLKNIKKLVCEDNNKLWNLRSISSSLEELNCSGEHNAVTQYGISELTNIRILNCSHNKNITDLSHMADSLEELNCSGEHNAVTQYGISKLTNVKVLNCSHNNNIRDLRCMSELLKELNCKENIHVGPNSASKFNNLKKLYCTGEKWIDYIEIYQKTLDEHEHSIDYKVVKFTYRNEGNPYRWKIINAVITLFSNIKELYNLWHGTM